MATPRNEGTFTEWSNNPWRIRTINNFPFQINPETQFNVLWGTAVIGRGQPGERVPAIERPPYVHTAVRGIPVLKVAVGAAAATSVDTAVGDGKNWILDRWAIWSDEGAAIASSVQISDSIDFCPVWTGTLAASAISSGTAQVGSFNGTKLLSGHFIRFNAAVSAGKTITIRVWTYEVDEE